MRRTGRSAARVSIQAVAATSQHQRPGPRTPSTTASQRCVLDDRGRRAGHRPRTVDPSPAGRPPAPGSGRPRRWGDLAVADDLGARTVGSSPGVEQGWRPLGLDHLTGCVEHLGAEPLTERRGDVVAERGGDIVGADPQLGRDGIAQGAADLAVEDQHPEGQDQRGPERRQHGEPGTQREAGGEGVEPAGLGGRCGRAHRDRRRYPCPRTVSMVSRSKGRSIFWRR